MNLEEELRKIITGWRRRTRSLGRLVGYDMAIK